MTRLRSRSRIKRYYRECVLTLALRQVGNEELRVTQAQLRIIQSWLQRELDRITKCSHGGKNHPHNKPFFFQPPLSNIYENTIHFDIIHFLTLPGEHM